MALGTLLNLLVTPGEPKTYQLKIEPILYFHLLQQFLEGLTTIKALNDGRKLTNSF